MTSPGGTTPLGETTTTIPPGAGCSAAAATLAEAKTAYASSCTEPRADCDPIAGEWMCSSEKIGANAPTAAPTTSGAFVESDGLVTIETVSLELSQGWRQFPSEAGNDPIRPGSTGGEYIQWGGGDDFANPGRGVITIPVEITEPGRYRFIWYSATGIGNQSSEHNDSWLRIDADAFYGEKPNSIVCPVGTPIANRCDGDAPEGRSADGWFKIYRSGTPTDGFTWQSTTSDSDGHSVFVEFDSPGTYEIEISGRSNGHAIDRIVLFRNGNDADNVSSADATNLTNPESQRR